MYEVDEKDQVVELKEFPQSSVGSPRPLVLADEYLPVILAYVVQERELWETPKVQAGERKDFGELVALVRLNGCLAHMFGMPNDEAITGHPLANRGLRPYAVFRIDNSSWVRNLERMNSVHRNHKPAKFWKKQHLIFVFHDSTFECVCDGFEVTTMRGSIESVIPQILKFLGSEGH